MSPNPSSASWGVAADVLLHKSQQLQWAQHHSLRIDVFLLHGSLWSCFLPVAGAQHCAPDPSPLYWLACWTQMYLKLSVPHFSSNISNLVRILNYFVHLKPFPSSGWCEWDKFWVLLLVSINGSLSDRDPTVPTFGVFCWEFSSLFHHE